MSVAKITAPRKEVHQKLPALLIGEKKKKKKKKKKKTKNTHAEGKVK